MSTSFDEAKRERHERAEVARLTDEPHAILERRAYSSRSAHRFGNATEQIVMTIDEWKPDLRFSDDGRSMGSSECWAASPSTFSIEPKCRSFSFPEDQIEQAWEGDQAPRLESTVTTCHPACRPSKRAHKRGSPRRDAGANAAGLGETPEHRKGRGT